MSVEPVKPAKKKLNPILILVPVAIVSALVLAFALPPSHAFIVNGPLKPIFARIGLASPSGARVAKAADSAADIKRLSDELDADRRAANAKDARIAELKAEVANLQAPPSPANSPAAAPKPSPTGVSDDVKRAAAYWAGMDAEKAADIAKALPNAYVKTVFGQMPPDAVAEIMNALPPKTAAKLTAAADPQAP